MNKPSLCVLASLAALPALLASRPVLAPAPSPNAAQATTPTQGLVRPSAGFCASSLADQASTGCLQASTSPALGRLFPLSHELFVDAATGFVGVGTVSPASRLHVDGRTTTRVLTITGGADLVESFSVPGATPEPGTVLVIDAAGAGSLVVSSRAYDRRVAGVVSGAGGVHAGLALGQEGALEGDVHVAIGGRLYVRCTSENGAVAPGDLLTTSSLAGHAMRASEPERAFGAVLGKALTSLDEGTGLVLVLVGLQ
jgi:hypothetical protein